MPVYRLYNCAHTASRYQLRVAGWWNPRRYGSGRRLILHASSTPELALSEIVARLNPSFIPGFHSLVLAIPDEHQKIRLFNLPANWQDKQEVESVPSHLPDCLTQPNMLTVSVLSAIVNRLRNYLLHTIHPDFSSVVTTIRNAPFTTDSRIINPEI